MYNLNKQGKTDSLSTIKRSYCPLSPIPSAVLFTVLPWLFWPTRVCAAEQGIIYRLVTISPFKVLNKVSVWAVKVDEEQSMVTFLVPTFFFFKFFSIFLTLKANSVC